MRRVSVKKAKFNASRFEHAVFLQGKISAPVFLSSQNSCMRKCWWLLWWSSRMNRQTDRQTDSCEVKHTYNILKEQHALLLTYFWGRILRNLRDGQRRKEAEKWRVFLSNKNPCYAQSYQSVFVDSAAKLRHGK